MDKEQIVRQTSQLSSKEDLLNLLNRIKRDEIEEMGLDASKFHPFTMRHINYYCNPNNVFHRYRQFHIKKKSGGYRVITAPRNPSFRLILQTVNTILKAIYTPSDYAMGFTKGRSVVSNATIHRGQNYVFNIDLKDFFPSVEQIRVWKRLQLKPFNFPMQIANIIAGLCSVRQARDVVDDTKTHENDKKYKYVLPQGSPVSPIITTTVHENPLTYYVTPYKHRSFKADTHSEVLNQLPLCQLTYCKQNKKKGSYEPRSLCIHSVDRFSSEKVF